MVDLFFSLLALVGIIILIGVLGVLGFLFYAGWVLTTPAVRDIRAKAKGSDIDGKVQP